MRVAGLSAALRETVALGYQSASDVSREARAQGANARNRSFAGKTYAPGRIRTCDPRIRSPPICLPKRRFSRLFKPNSSRAAGNLLPDNSESLVVFIANRPLDTWFGDPDDGTAINGSSVAGGILRLVNKNGNPGTLVSAYPGNTNAARHGAYSPRLIEPRASEIEEELIRGFEFTATQRVAVHEVAHCMAILDAIDHDLDERGLVDRSGESRSIIKYRARISRELDRWLAKISPAIDRQTAEDHEGRQIGRPDYVRELQRIALGDDSTATARDRLSAIDRLADLEPRNAVTQVTLNYFLDEHGDPVLGPPETRTEPQGRTQQRDELEVSE